MALADFEPKPASSKRRGCALGKFIDKLDEQDQLTISIWLIHRPDMYATDINASLKECFPEWHGSDKMVQDHRRTLLGRPACGCDS